MLTIYQIEVGLLSTALLCGTGACFIGRAEMDENSGSIVAVILLAIMALGSGAIGVAMVLADWIITG